MPHPRKPDPQKNCRHCKAPMARKRTTGNRLEDLATFVRRKFCDRKCMAASMEGVIKVLNPKNSRRQSGKAVLPKCEWCGVETKRHVHHADEDPLNNAASNLRTLCASCHARSHSPNWDRTTGLRKPCAHCSKDAQRKGLCWTHLTRSRRYGDPLATKRS